MNHVVMKIKLMASYCGEFYSYAAWPVCAINHHHQQQHMKNISNINQHLRNISINIKIYIYMFWRNNNKKEIHKKKKVSRKQL